MQVDVSYGESFLAGGQGVDVGDELREEGGVLERECVGGVDDVLRFVIDLSTRAEEIDGDIHASP